MLVRHREAALPAPPRVVIAHRGGPGDGFPEETMAAMRHAGRLHTMLEFDMRWTADDRVVLLHDATLDRVTDCTGPVSDWTYADLVAQCPVGGQPIATLEDVVDYARDARLWIAPQFGHGDPTDARLAQVMAVIAGARMQSRTWMQSFTLALIGRVRAADPSHAVRYVFLTSAAVDPADVTAAGVRVVAPYLGRLTSAQVSGYHRHGLAVWPWTATNTTDLTRTRSLAADGVFTDLPARAVATYR